MEQNKTLYETLLAYVDIEDYYNLIQWENLKAKGYKIHFIIDADVIHKYCFPHGIDSVRYSKYQLTESYLHDEQITLFSLFYSHVQNQKIVVLDEYIPEIKQMIKSASQEFNVKQKDVFKDLKIDERIRKEGDFIKDYYSEIIGSVLENIGGLEKIRDLLNEHKFVIDSKEFGDQELQKIFDEEKGSGELAPGIEKFFQEPSRIKKDNVLQYQETVSLINRKVDSKAIERTFEINRRLINGVNKSGKNIYLFFGDSDVIKRLFKNYSHYAPVIDGDKVSLYCSTQQYFAYLICREYLNKEDKIDRTKTIQNIKILSDKHRHITQMYEYKFNETVSINSRLFTNYRSLRNRLENIGLFKNTVLLGNKFFEFFKDDELVKLKEFINQLSEKKDELNKSLQKEWLTILTGLEIEAERNKVFLDLIENIRKGEDSFAIARGNDVIEGTYQILPIFINFHDDPKSTFYNDSIFLITELVLQKDEIKSAVICDKMYDLLSDLGRVRFSGDFPHQLKLLKALVFLVLPIQSRTNQFANDEEVYKWICNAHEIMQSNIEKVYLDLSEFYYVACWVARRVTKYRESIDFANFGIAKYLDDPRFYHGKALALYCQYASSEKKQTIDNILAVIGLTEKAFYLYTLYINRNYSQSRGAILAEKIKECFFNNFSFFYAEAASFFQKKPHGEGEYYIKVSRKYLDNLKSIYKRGGMRLAEYYDTEGFVEFNESFFSKTKDDSLRKLYFANSAMETALSLGSSISQDTKYVEMINKIKQRIKNLNETNRDED